MKYKQKQRSRPEIPIVATSMHIKQTNTSTYVTPESQHPQHTFNNNCYNAGLRIRKINDNRHYNYFCGFFIAALLSRKYQMERINREFAKTQHLTQLEAMDFHPPADTIATFPQLYPSPQTQQHHTQRQKKKSYNKRKGAYKHKPQLLSQLALSKRYVEHPKTITPQIKSTHPNHQTRPNKDIHPATIFLSMIDDKRMPNAREIIYKHYHILTEEKENIDLYPQFEIAKNAHFNLRNLIGVNHINHILLEKKQKNAGSAHCQRPKCKHTHGLLKQTTTFSNQFSLEPYH